MNAPRPQIFGTVRRRLRRAAPRYDSRAALPERVGEALLEHLDPVRLEPSLVLDVGAGTGTQARRLADRYPKARVLALDLSDAMLLQARRKARRLFSRQRFACADAATLPLPDGCADLVFSNLGLGVDAPLTPLFAELHRVLRAGGLLALSLPGPDTLRELRECWEDSDADPRVHRFPDMHDVGDALVAAGCQGVVMDTERLTCTYRDLAALHQELRDLGLTNLLPARHRGLTGRSRLRRAEQAYETRRRDGVLPATVEVVYAHAWAGRPTGSGVDVPGPVMRG